MASKDEGLAKRAVRAEMARRRWTAAELAREAGVDEGTVRDFTDGPRWAQVRTRGAIEAAFEWPSGTIENIAYGDAPPDVGAVDDDPPGVLLDIRPGDYEDIGPEGQAEAKAAAEAEYRKRAREIRRLQDGD